MKESLFTKILMVDLASFQSLTLLLELGICYTLIRLELYEANQDF